MFKKCLSHSLYVATPSSGKITLSPYPLSRHQQLLHPPGKGRQASVLALFDYCSFIAPAGFGVFAHPAFGVFAHPRFKRFAHREMGFFLLIPD
jgi:hypothetical protein